MSAALMQHETEALARFGARMFDILFEQFCDGAWEIEVNDLITEHSVRAGLVDSVDYDPEQHDDPNGACEPGDDYYVISETGRKARALARATGEAA